MDQIQHKSFRLTFKGRWYEYFIGGWVLMIIGNSIADSQNPLKYLGLIIEISGLFITIFGIWKGIVSLIHKLRK